MNLLKLQNEIHQQNKDMGWWDAPRSYDVFVCLFHSELSEAMEGDRKNLMDDHLPNYEMFWVELADFVIRVMDYLGSIGNKEYGAFCFKKTYSNTQLLARVNRYVSASIDIAYNMPAHDVGYMLDHCVKLVLSHAKTNSIDLFQIIEEKRAYNLTRADHKPENRAKVNGKKY